MSRNWTVSLFLLLAQCAVGISFGQPYYQPPANVNYATRMPQQRPMMQAPNYGPAQMAAMQQAYANQVRQAAYFRQHSQDSQRIMADQKWAQMRDHANAELAQRQWAVQNMPYAHTDIHPAYRQQQPTYQQQQPTNQQQQAAYQQQQQAAYQQQQAIYQQQPMYQQRQAAYQQQPTYHQRAAPATPARSFVRRSPQQAISSRYVQSADQTDPFADMNQDPLVDDPFADQPEVEMQDPFGDPPQDAQQPPLEFIQDPFGDPQDTVLQQQPANTPDPFGEPPTQQSQDPFADFWIEQEPIDPFADPPSDPDPPEPQSPEPVLPGGIIDVPEVPRENQQRPVPPPQIQRSESRPAQPAAQYPLGVVTPPVVQHETTVIPPKAAPTTPDARPIAPLHTHPETVTPRPSIPKPSRVGSPEAFIPQSQVQGNPPPSPYSNMAPNYPPGFSPNAPMNPPAAQRGAPNMQMQSYPQMQPGQVYPGSLPNHAQRQRCCPDVSRTRDCSCNSCADSCCELPFYFSVFGGYSGINSFDEVTNLGVGQNILDFDDGYGVGFALGAEQGFNLRTEIDFAFRQLNLNSLTNQATPPSATTGNLNLYSGMANLYWEFMRFPNQRFKPYVGAGVGFVFLDPDFVSGGASIPGGDDSNFAYQGMVGLNYKHNYRADLFVEYRYFSAYDVSLDSPEVALSQFDLEMDNVFFGIRLKF